ncbi:MAG: PIN domain-containing protein [Candidatus Limnocylindrales bacterium]
MGPVLSVLDAQALIAALTDEPAAAEVEALLRGAHGPPRIAAVNFAEVVDVLVRIKARPIDQVRRALELLRAGGLDVIPVDAASGELAGTIRARRYRRRDVPLPLSDCVLLATGAILDDAIATSDPPLLAAARAEGIAVVPLPDARGLRP